MVIPYYPGADSGTPAPPPASPHQPERDPFDMADPFDMPHPFDMSHQFDLEPSDQPQPGRRYQPGQLEQFRAALAEQRRFRLEQLCQLATAQPAASDQLGEVTAALRTAATAALGEIDAALDRLRDGSYGRCLHCRRTIHVERLETLPAAALCMSCQHAAEAPAR